MKYRIIILIIIIISLGQILLSYIVNTSCMPAHTHTRTYTQARTHMELRLSLFDGSVVPNHDGPFRWRRKTVAASLI